MVHSLPPITFSAANQLKQVSATPLLCQSVTFSQGSQLSRGHIYVFDSPNGSTTTLANCIRIIPQYVLGGINKRHRSETISVADEASGIDLSQLWVATNSILPAGFGGTTVISYVK